MTVPTELVIAAGTLGGGLMAAIAWLANSLRNSHAAHVSDLKACGQELREAHQVAAALAKSLLEERDVRSKERARGRAH